MIMNIGRSKEFNMSILNNIAYLNTIATIFFLWPLWHLFYWVLMYRTRAVFVRFSLGEGGQSFDWL